MADKTSNMYLLKKEEYKNLLLNNVTKTYRKAGDEIVDKINKEAKVIAEKLELDDRINQLAENPAYITLKDHKENFNINPKCRLINPTKSEIGRVSKMILEKANNEIRSALKLLQWKDPQEVISWFDKINNKKNFQFIQFDVQEFYPSITEELLRKAIIFGQEHTKINDDEIKIIYNAAQSVLYHDGEVWVKKKNSSNPTFDITMGGYHGAEVCEIVGLYMLHEMTKFIPKDTVGLYRDDGLMITPKQSGYKTEKLKQRLHQFAKSIGLSFEIEGPMQQTNFLDVTLNLHNEIYAPFRKENNDIRYIRLDSNHPKTITRQIPNMIGKRISKRSINEEEFAKASTDYNIALKQSGYSEKIKYEADIKPKQRNRKRKVVWFNPPFCRTVKTNVARKFIELTKNHFNKDHPLNKIFNKNTINLSYSCMPNMKTIINRHNKKLLKKKTKKEIKPCNCKKFECPMKYSKTSCREESVIYEATVQSKTETKHYIGITANEFKTRYYKHRQDFSNKDNMNSTALSKYIWEMKSNNEEYKIRWKILKSISKMQNGNKMCRLCVTEAALIMKERKGQLNKRNEIMNKCRHQNKFLLKNWKEKKKDNKK